MTGLEVLRGLVLSVALAGFAARLGITGWAIVSLWR